MMAVEGSEDTAVKLLVYRDTVMPFDTVRHNTVSPSADSATLSPRRSDVNPDSRVFWRP